jgi:hypothetical protein
MSVLVEAYGILVGLNSTSSRRPPLNLMIGSILVYLVFLFALTFLVPTSDSAYREAMGLVCKKQFLDLYGPACYWIEPEVLAKASFESDRIWEFWSVELVRGLLCAIWLLVVWSVVVSISISIKLTTKPASRVRTKGDRKSP